MTVRILVDPYRVEKQPGAYHVSTQREYVHACTVIDEALAARRELAVAVHNRAMHDWFDQYREHSDVVITVTDPREILAGRLGVRPRDLPTEVQEDPGVIVSQGLIERAAHEPLAQDQTPESWLLEATIGAAWARDHLDESSQITDLLLELALGGKQDLHPTVLALRDRRLRAWCSDSRYGPLVRWLIEGSVKRRAEALLLARLIWRYPLQVQKTALQFEGRWVELLQLEDRDSIMEAIRLEQCARLRPPAGYVQAVGTYLKEALEEHSIEAVLPVLSGCLREEAAALRSYLLDNLHVLDPSWSESLSKVAQLFSASGAFSEFVEFVRRLQPVPVPGPLSSQARWPEAQAWLEDAYFPFYSWCLAVDRLQDTAQSVAQFEDWLLANYDAVTRMGAFAPYATRDILTACAENGPVLLVVVDGLPWTYALSLRRELSAHGASFIDIHSHVTTIPSTTPIAKPCLIRGQLPGHMLRSDDCDLDYAGLLAAALGLDRSQVAWATSRDTTASDMVRQQRRAYLYLFNDVDMLIHQPWSAEKRASQIGTKLAELAADIVASRREFRMTYGQELVVIIASDHGFTELPKQPPSIRLPTECPYHVSHGRVVDCDADADPPAGDVAVIGSGLLGGAPAAFAVPRGYACVGQRPKGGTHGGLTPQEVVVPLAVLDVSKDITYTDLEVALDGEVRRGRPLNQVTLRLANSNPVPIVVRSLDLRLMAFAAEMPLRVPANDAISVLANIDAASLRQQDVTIAGRVAVELRGEPFTTEVSITLKTTGAATTDQSFEDEFDV